MHRYVEFRRILRQRQNKSESFSCHFCYLRSIDNNERRSDTASHVTDVGTLYVLDFVSIYVPQLCRRAPYNKTPRMKTILRQQLYKVEYKKETIKRKIIATRYLHPVVVVVTLGKNFPLDEYT